MHRRSFLKTSEQSFAALAAATLLRQEDAALAASGGGVVEVLHHAARAKRVIQLFMGGAASHIDLWDYKPALEKIMEKNRTSANPSRLFRTDLDRG